MGLIVRECLQRINFSKWIPSALLKSKKEINDGREISPQRDFSTTRFLRVKLAQDEASLIKARLPKGASPAGLYLRENFETKHKEMTKAGSLPDKNKIAAVLKHTIEDFKALPASQAQKYFERSALEREAYKKAYLKLTEQEREALSVDKKKKNLKRRITSLRKQLNKLRRDFEYPPASSASSFILFVKHNKRLLLADEKSVTATAKAASAMWKQLSESEKEIFDVQAKHLLSEAKLRQAEWRRETALTNKAALDKMDNLKSEIIKLKIRLTKIDKSPSIEDASRVIKKSLKKKKIVKKAKSTATKKKSSKKVGLKAKKVHKTALTKKKTPPAKAAGKKETKKTAKKSP